MSAGTEPVESYPPLKRVCPGHAAMYGGLREYEDVSGLGLGEIDVVVELRILAEQHLLRGGEVDLVTALDQTEAPA